MTGEQNSQLNNWVELHNSILSNIQGATKELELLYEKKKRILEGSDAEIVAMEKKIEETKKELSSILNNKESELSQIEKKKDEVEMFRAMLKEEQDKQKETLLKIQKDVEAKRKELSDMNMNVLMLRSDKEILSKEIEGLLLLRAEKNELVSQRNEMVNEIRELTSGIDMLYRFHNDYRRKAMKELEEIEEVNKGKREEFLNKMEDIQKFKKELAEGLVDNYKKERDIEVIKERLEKFAKEKFNFNIKI